MGTYVIVHGVLGLHSIASLARLPLSETVSAGGIVGEMALVTSGPRSATVRAVTPSIVIPIDQHRFLFLVQETPNFALRMMHVTCSRLLAMNATRAVLGELPPASEQPSRLLRYE